MLPTYKAPGIVFGRTKIHCYFSLAFVDQSQVNVVPTCVDVVIVSAGCLKMFYKCIIWMDNGHVDR